jgi:hypothetical protein
VLLQNTWLYKYSKLRRNSLEVPTAPAVDTDNYLSFLPLEYLPSHPRLVEEPWRASPCRSQEEFIFNSKLQATLELSEKYSKLHEFRVSWAYDISTMDYYADPCYFRVSEMKVTRLRHTLHELPQLSVSSKLISKAWICPKTAPHLEDGPRC